MLFVSFLCVIKNKKMNFRSCLILTLNFLFFFISCKEKMKTKKVIIAKKVEVVKEVVKVKPKQEKKLKSFNGINDSTFIRLIDFSKDFAYDMRYATKNNFLKEQVYECAECYTRVNTAKALIAVNNEFLKNGVKIKFFDCYRPNSVQYKMWKIKPNPQYVANPKKGSVHNRGGAVDITLETVDGKELDMGTDFDFFGWKAYHDNYNLPDNVLKNRKLLKTTMEKHGFKSVRSEWWHYNLSSAYRYKVANFTWDCK